MAVVETYRVKKSLKTGGRTYFAGELLPEAAEWPFAVREQRIRVRLIEKVSVDSAEMEAHLARIAAENAVEIAPEGPPAPVEAKTETDQEVQEPEIPVLSESAVDEEEDEEISELDDEEEEEQEAEVQSSEAAPTPKKIVRKRRG